MIALLIRYAIAAAALLLVFVTLSAALADGMVAGILTLLASAILLPALMRREGRMR